MRLEADFTTVDYYSLETSSPILKYLSEDERFAAFSRACASFYKSALSVKRVVYGDIQDAHGRWVSSGQVGVGAMVALWQAEVEKGFREVATQYMHIRVLKPK
jgi:hypothetical protein